MSDKIRETRTAAFAACPDTGCDWSSFWRGWQAALAAAHAAPVARFLPDLPDQMARDLARFNETCEDSQEYDIPKERMRSMASFGLVRWCGGSRFEITDCGIAALDAMAAPPAAEQPDIVGVPRELLEDAARWLEAYSPGSGSEESYTAQDLRAAAGRRCGMSGVKRHDLQQTGLRTGSGDPLPKSVVAECDYDALAQRCRALEVANSRWLTENEDLLHSLMGSDMRADALRDEIDTLRAEVRRYKVMSDNYCALAMDSEAEAAKLRAELEQLRAELQEERSTAESVRFSAWRHGDFLSVRDLLGMFCPDGVAGVAKAGMEHVARRAADEVEQLRQRVSRYEHQRRLNPGDLPAI